MLPPEPEPTDPEAVADEEPPTILRRRIPAAAAAEPRGAITPGRDVEEEVEDCDCDEPLGMVWCTLVEGNVFFSFLPFFSFNFFFLLDRR